MADGANFIAMQPAQLQALANMMRGPSTKLRRMTEATPEAWLEYRRHFVKIAQLQGWDDARSRQELAAGIQEKAGNAVSDININAAGIDVDDVLNMYQARFLPAAAGTTARTNYQTAKQLPTESVREWHTRVRELFFLAYPNGVIDHEHHSMDIFINGLYLPQVHFFTASQDIPHFTAALPVAERSETANRKQKQPSVHTVNARPVPNQAQANSLAPQGSGNCYFCADVFKVQNPHLKNQCPYFKTANRLYQSHKKPTNSSASTSSNQPNRGFNRRSRNNRQQNHVNAVTDTTDELDLSTTELFDEAESQGN